MLTWIWIGANRFVSCVQHLGWQLYVVQLYVDTTMIHFISEGFKTSILDYVDEVQ